MLGIICLTLSHGWWGWKASTFYLTQLNISVGSKLIITCVLNYSCHVIFEGMKTDVKDANIRIWICQKFQKYFIYAQTTTIKQQLWYASKELLGNFYIAILEYSKGLFLNLLVLLCPWQATVLVFWCASTLTPRCSFRCSMHDLWHVRVKKSASHIGDKRLRKVRTEGQIVCKFLYPILVLNLRHLAHIYEKFATENSKTRAERGVKGHSAFFWKFIHIWEKRGPLCCQAKIIC